MLTHTFMNDNSSNYFPNTAFLCDLEEPIVCCYCRDRAQVPIFLAASLSDSDFLFKSPFLYNNMALFFYP